MDIEGEEQFLLPRLLNLFKERSIHIFLSTHGKQVHQQLVKVLRADDFNLIPLDGKELESCTEIYCYR
jgi:hypothetical protein